MSRQLDPAHDRTEEDFVSTIALQAMLQPHGVAVYLEAQHLCTQMRWVREEAPSTRTTFWRGVYDAEPAMRAEFLAACGIWA
jgi:GTP cyclohydrolase IA